LRFEGQNVHSIGTLKHYRAYFTNIFQGSETFMKIYAPTLIKYRKMMQK
jgi:hypothetical protein